MVRRGRVATATAALVALALVHVALAVDAYRRQSAVWDEPQHLAAGHAALAAADFRVDPEHPPLVRLWAALPLLALDVAAAEAGAIDRADPFEWVGDGQYRHAHRLLYRDNDADRLLYPARGMIVLLGLGLGLVLYLWARRRHGTGPALAVAALFVLEPNLRAHGTLVTTDLGVTLFTFLSCYLLWRLADAITAGRVAALALAFALALVSKHSALLLCPLLAVLLCARAARREPWPWRLAARHGRLGTRRARLGAAAALLLLVVALGYAGIWASYGLRFRAAPAGGRPLDLHRAPPVASRLPRLARLTGWAVDRRLLPEAYLEGFLFGQYASRSRQAFLAGRYSADGWWFYFPAAVLLKTPLAVLAMAAVGLALVVARARRAPAALLAGDLFVWLPPLAWLAAAMVQHLNIGLRHVLPMYPFLLLLAGEALAAAWRGGRRPARLLAAGGMVVAAVELGGVYPHTLAFFNLLAGGPAGGWRYLVDSNLDWGQDLKGLGAWLERHGVRQVNLSYFGTAAPGYYRIDATRLPGSSSLDGGREELPRLPGWVAVSVTNLQGPYMNQAGRDFYRPLRERPPDDRIGWSIHLYRVERPWWPGGAAGGRPEPVSDRPDRDRDR